MPAKESGGIVSNCSGENLDGFLAKGRFSDCLVRNYTDGAPDCYRLYNSTAESNVGATYTEIPLEQGVTGELAYRMSHGEGCGEWGQKLSVDQSPRIYYGQTPASDTYVTRLTSYAAAHPGGIVEYMNAGKGIEAAPGYFKVCDDLESWTTHPDHNFIVSHGDGSYSADVISLDPATAHHLPLEVEAGAFAYGETAQQGQVVSLMFPVDVPVDRLNGTVYLLKKYDGTAAQVEFVNAKGLAVVPASLPFLLKVARDGEVLAGGSYSESYPLPVSPMTGANGVELDGVTHLASYAPVTVPGDDGCCYFRLTGTKSRGAAPAGMARAAAALSAVQAGAGDFISPFEAYFAIPADSGAASSLSVALTEDKTSALDSIGTDASEAFPCEVWSLDGIRLATAASAADLHSLAPGIYALRSAGGSRLAVIR